MQLDTLTMWNTAGWVTSFWDRQLVMRVYIIQTQALLSFCSLVRLNV